MAVSAYPGNPWYALGVAPHGLGMWTVRATLDTSRDPGNPWSTIQKPNPLHRYPIKYLWGRSL